ncbi:hypothetical protein GCM10009560_70260 [Nonomuraea longicatena]|uniref:Uncharacterized protein n=1 Tax=Nonomuraea longicatena TaxID=83682 RepID=A0ABP4BGK7_9ACTN
MMIKVRGGGRVAVAVAPWPVAVAANRVMAGLLNGFVGVVGGARYPRPAGIRADQSRFRGSRGGSRGRDRSRVGRDPANPRGWRVRRGAGVVQAALSRRVMAVWTAVRLAPLSALPSRLMSTDGTPSART